MVVMIVTCTGCGKGGQFDINLRFDPKHESCKSCGHQSERPWQYQFCILSCFMNWMKENNISEGGFPCNDCLDMETGKPSGFWCNSKAHGPCKTCGGKLTVRGRAVAVDPWAEMEKKKGITQ